MKKTGIFFKYLGNDLDELYQERISSLSGDIQAAKLELWRKESDSSRERRKNFLTWD